MPGCYAIRILCSLIASSDVLPIVFLKHLPDIARQWIVAGSTVIFAVHMPAVRVVDDVLPDSIQGAFVTDDVFIVVALPDWFAGGVAQSVDTFGHGRFE